MSTCNGVKIFRFRVEGFRRHRRFHRMCKLVYEQPHTLEDERLWMRYQGPIAPGLYRHLEETRSSYAAVLFFTYLYPPTVDGITIAPEHSILVPTAHDEPPLYLSIFRPVFHSARQILYNTEEEKLLVQRTFGNSHVPSRIAGVGVELPPAHEAGDAPAGFAGRLQAGKFFLYLGRVDINKGVKELSEWFSSDNTSNSERGDVKDYPLALAGTPVMPVRQHPRVHMLGEVSEPQKAWLLRNCVALILPSLYESLSLSALEAWAYGKPVAARRGSMVLERHIQDSSAGLLFHDAGSLTQALREFSSDPGSGARMGRQGREYVAANYCWESVTAAYRNAIEEVSPKAPGDCSSV